MNSMKTSIEVKYRLKRWHNHNSLMFLSKTLRYPFDLDDMILQTLRNEVKREAHRNSRKARRIFFNGSGFYFPERMRDISYESLDSKALENAAKKIKQWKIPGIKIVEAKIK